MNEFNKPEHSYLFGILNSSRAMRILDFLLDKTDKSATYAEIEQRPHQSMDAPRVSVIELMKAGLIECFNSKGDKIPIVVSRSGESYKPEKNVYNAEIIVKVSKFAQDLIKFLDKNSTSLDLFP